MSVAVTDGSQTENLNEIAVRLWTGCAGPVNGWFATPKLVRWLQLYAPPRCKCGYENRLVAISASTSVNPVPFPAPEPPSLCWLRTARSVITQFRVCAFPGFQFTTMLIVGPVSERTAFMRNRWPSGVTS
jgi:hypothetical protein